MAVSSFNALASASASTNNLYWFDLASAESKRSNLGFTSGLYKISCFSKTNNSQTTVNGSFDSADGTVLEAFATTDVDNLSTTFNGSSAYVSISQDAAYLSLSPSAECFISVEKLQSAPALQSSQLRTFTSSSAVTISADNVIAVLGGGAGGGSNGAGGGSGFLTVGTLVAGTYSAVIGSGGSSNGSGGQSSFGTLVANGGSGTSGGSSGGQALSSNGNGNVGGSNGNLSGVAFPSFAGNPGSGGTGGQQYNCYGASGGTGGGVYAGGGSGGRGLGCTPATEGDGGNSSSRGGGGGGPGRSSEGLGTPGTGGSGAVYVLEWI
jgi:hypothetical protein